MKFCNKCGQQLNDDVGFCNKCGNKIEAVVTTIQDKPGKRKFKKMTKKEAIIISILLLILFTVFVNKDNIKESNQQVANKSLSSFAETTKITSEQESGIMSILNECGINEIKKIEHDEMLDGWNTQTEKGYRATVGEINNVIIYIDNGVLSAIRYADNDLYKGGKIIEPLSNFMLTDNEINKLK